MEATCKEKPHRAALPPETEGRRENWTWNRSLGQAEHGGAVVHWTRVAKGGWWSWLCLISYRHRSCRVPAVAVPWGGSRVGVLGSPPSSTSHKGAWSHLLCLAMGSGQSDSTAVHPTLPEQTCLKAQFRHSVPFCFQPLPELGNEKAHAREKQSVENKKLS